MNTPEEIPLQAETTGNAGTLNAIREIANPDFGMSNLHTLLREDFEREIREDFDKCPWNENVEFPIKGSEKPCNPLPPP